MTLVEGQNKLRQVARTLAGIREDHLARYRLAVAEAKKRGLDYACDFGCGIGYGCSILAKEGGLIWVNGYDRNFEAINFAHEHYDHPDVCYFASDIAVLRDPKAWPNYMRDPLRTLITAFEIIEHTEAAPEVLAASAQKAWLLVGSVPNEEVVPFRPGRGINPEHYRHYTASEIRAELDFAGWRVVFMGCQTGKTGAGAVVRPHGDAALGRTLVFVAKSMYLS